MQKDVNLVWVDLEMTGLNPEKDLILEIAVLITDKDLNIVAEGPDLAINYIHLPEMCEWVTNAHTTSGLLDKAKSSHISLKEAEVQVFNFIAQYAQKGKSFLCGNSIWQDKQFLQKHMPSIVEYLHYRIIDVSTVKELVKLWYPDSPAAEFQKVKAHRALDDIKESISELNHYKKHFFI